MCCHLRFVLPTGAGGRRYCHGKGSPGRHSMTWRPSGRVDCLTGFGTFCGLNSSSIHQYCRVRRRSSGAGSIPIPEFCLAIPARVNDSRGSDALNRMMIGPGTTTGPGRSDAPLVAAHRRRPPGRAHCGPLPRDPGEPGPGGAAPPTPGGRATRHGWLSTWRAPLPRARQVRPHDPGTGSRIDHVLVMAPRIPVPSLRSFS